jgi:putative SOS response-associated peptidase YedK
MCNLYSVTRSQEAMRRLFRAKRDLTGNFPGLPDVFPDVMAPLVQTAPDGERELFLVPATSFCEWSDTRPKVTHWFALDERRPLFAFAGIWRL